MKYNLSFSFIFLVLLSGCDSFSKAKKGASRNNERDFVEKSFDKSNIILEQKVYQFPDTLSITRNKIRVWGHDKEVELDLSKSGLNLNCEQTFDYEIIPLVSWDFEEPDYIIPSHCYKSDSLVLSSKPRVYRGDRPEAWIYDAKTNTQFNIDTRYFDHIFALIQLSKDIFVVLYDDSTKYGEDEFSFMYALVKLDR